MNRSGIAAGSTSKPSPPLGNVRNREDRFAANDHQGREADIDADGLNVRFPPETGELASRLGGQAAQPTKPLCSGTKALSNSNRVTGAPFFTSWPHPGDDGETAST
jgi:hypothetical protein